MDIKEYYIRQIAKTNKKNYENYIVTRLLALLDDTAVKFITQQAVRATDSNKRFLIDLYFPQIDLHIEIDEGHHKGQKTEDVAREADIVRATSHDIRRIDATKDLKGIHDQIHMALLEIMKRIKNKKDFMPWDIEKEFDPEFYIKKGYIDLADKVAFRKKADACSCFGKRYKALQPGATKHPSEKDTILWFPKLYENDAWDNTISDDEKTIFERKKNDEGGSVDRDIVGLTGKHIFVFAHAKDSLGATLYRFKGVFQMDVEETRKAGQCVYTRIATRVKTYIPKE